jgi:hypothetical protein
MPHYRPSTPHQTDQVRALDIQLGDDGDIPGFAIDLTPDDIDDIAFDTNLAADDRVARLEGIASELEQRRAGDYMGDMESLLDHVRDRMASLRARAEGEATLGSVGMDASDRREDDDVADRFDMAGDGEDPDLDPEDGDL